MTTFKINNLSCYQSSFVEEEKQLKTKRSSKNAIQDGHQIVPENEDHRIVLLSWKRISESQDPPISLKIFSKFVTEKVVQTRPSCEVLIESCGIVTSLLAILVNPSSVDKAFLKTLGKEYHSKNLIDKDIYVTIGAATMFVVKKYLENDYKTELRKAWLNWYCFVMVEFLKGTSSLSNLKFIKVFGSLEKAEVILNGTE
eukprot:Awhi_evm1s8773